MKFLIVKKRSLIFALIVIVIFSSCFATYFSVRPASSPKPKYSIVIDAGHGGIDGGAVGRESGITESELNLRYAKQLEKLCLDVGIEVVMTRSDMNGLYDENASNRKKSEMEKRKEIINSSGADCLVSIHMNSFPVESCNGAQIFYCKGSQEGFRFAKSVQEVVCQNFSNARNYVTAGDYFVLNNSNIPAILIECGFLTNPNEEISLIDEKYCEKFCYSILAGIMSYFEM